jgi:hypothetical protein
VETGWRDAQKGEVNPNSWSQEEPQPKFKFSSSPQTLGIVYRILIPLSLKKYYPAKSRKPPQQSCNSAPRRTQNCHSSIWLRFDVKTERKNGVFLVSGYATIRPSEDDSVGRSVFCGGRAARLAA